MQAFRIQFLRRLFPLFFSPNICKYERKNIHSLESFSFFSGQLCQYKNKSLNIGDNKGLTCSRPVLECLAVYFCFCSNLKLGNLSDVAIEKALEQ